MSKPKLGWKLLGEWRRSELARGELGSWATPNGENTVVVKKEERLFVVEASDYMGEYTRRIVYTDAQDALDGAYDEMWGRSPDCQSG
jgi:hypothetical protein